jgi:signal transduction histidine kinase
VMGFLTIAAMFGTYFVSKWFDNETVTIVSVSAVGVAIFTVGSFVVRGFEKVAEANVLKSEFISIISHQLCTPLSAIRWNLEIFEAEQEKRGAFSEKERNFLSNIGKANTKMLKLVSDLLEVVRIDQGKTVFKIEDVDLAQLARDVIGELEHLRVQKNIKIVEMFDVELPRVKVDAGKMKVVLENIIGNALKYSQDGQEVAVAIKYRGEEVTVIVRDKGVGIPRHQHSQIFEKFFRSSNSSKYRTEGVGIGLYLVKAILKHFDGRVWFESEEGEGSTFYVSLPVK